MKRLPVSLVLASLVLSGCGSDDADGEARPAPSSPSTSPSSESSAPEPTSSPSLASAVPGNPDLPNDPAARREVKRALHGLIGPGTGCYTVDLDLGPGAAIHEEGRYQIDPNAYESTRHLVSKDGVVTFAYKAVGDDTWVRLEEAADVSGDDPKSWPCWAHVDPQIMADQLDVPAAATGQPPNALLAASYAVGLGFADEPTGTGNVLGTTDLVLSLALLNGQTIAKTGLDPSSDATTLSYLDVRKGVLVGYSVGLRALFQAVEAAGGTLPDGVDVDSVAGSITVRFSDIGKPVEVQAPAADEVVEMTGDTAAFEDDLRACGSA